MYLIINVGIHLITIVFIHVGCSLYLNIHAGFCYLVLFFYFFAHAALCPYITVPYVHKCPVSSAVPPLKRCEEQMRKIVMVMPSRNTNNNNAATTTTNNDTNTNNNTNSNKNSAIIIMMGVYIYIYM